MGGPKLLLPWGEGLLIDHVLAAWTASNVNQVVVVVRHDDVALIEACRRHDVRIVIPDRDPVDMKESIQSGIRALQSVCRPSEADRCFIAPADLPTLATRIIDALVATEADIDTIVAPQFGEKQGHPVLLPWPMIAEIFHLGPDEGVDRVVGRHPKRSVLFPPGDLVMDVDTPQEYERLKAMTEHPESGEQPKRNLLD